MAEPHVSEFAQHRDFVGPYGLSRVGIVNLVAVYTVDDILRVVDVDIRHAGLGPVPGELHLVLGEPTRVVVGLVLTGEPFGPVFFLGHLGEFRPEEIVHEERGHPRGLAVIGAVPREQLDGGRVFHDFPVFLLGRVRAGERVIVLGGHGIGGFLEFGNLFDNPVVPVLFGNRVPLFVAVGVRVGELPHLAVVGGELLVPARVVQPVHDLDVGRLQVLHIVREHEGELRVHVVVLEALVHGLVELFQLDVRHRHRLLGKPIIRIHICIFLYFTYLF